MGEIIIPVLLSLLLGPGVGQLYNKEYKKGSYLIVLSLLVAVSACVWFKKAIFPYLPTDLTTVDPMSLPKLMQEAINHVVSSHGAVVATYEAILFALWIYGVIDAYFGGVRRRMAKKPVSGAHTS